MKVQTKAYIAMALITTTLVQLIQYSQPERLTYMGYNLGGYIIIIQLIVTVMGIINHTYIKD